MFCQVDIAFRIAHIYMPDICCQYRNCCIEVHLDSNILFKMAVQNECLRISKRLDILRYGHATMLLELGENLKSSQRAARA
jgi:hypothetical protein